MDGRATSVSAVGLAAHTTSLHVRFRRRQGRQGNFCEWFRMRDSHYLACHPERGQPADVW